MDQLTQEMFTDAQIEQGGAILDKSVEEFSIGSIVFEFLDFLRSINATSTMNLKPEQLSVHPESLCADLLKINT